ncbi:DUF4083 domain-containing protein [Bacillus sinesaloumensis]|uniref:DUF4083 domain-containing protein n=1 Tax=Litchfieldia sinesaloumensis TaxID=1926280 RepID=UPI0009883DA6|nr:DUF4083 domain-containing protein [Bacillus sinesaloumensis]
MEGLNVVSIVLMVIVIGLIALFIVSFTLFIRRIVMRSSVKDNQTNEIEKKLDKIIELLEKNKTPS